MKAARTVAIAALLALAATALPIAASAAQPRRSGAVSVYPSPGAQTASPATQLTFRGVAPRAIGPIEVVGSLSGAHAGRLAAHSDRMGASLIPDRPFSAGEGVTVRTRLDVAGARNGDFRLTIATPGPPLTASPLPTPIVTGPDVQRFHSRHDLVPPRMTVNTASRDAAPRSVFLGALSAPGGQGPGQVGPMVLDGRGRLLWFHPLGGNELALDVRVQTYRGQSVMTWWQGFNNLGLGNGVGVIVDRSYRRIAVVHAGNGMGADLHEFLLTPRNTALVLAENPVVRDLSRIQGATRAVVYDSVVQEIDIPTGLVLFEWHSLDHVDVSESHMPPARVDGQGDDYFHINSVAELDNGDLLVCARNTWGVYKIDRPTGDLAWRLGGTRSSFKAGPGATFSWQHDARVRPDGTITVYDDGPSPGSDAQSRGMVLRLDTRRRTVRLVHDYRHTPKLLANSQGNMQTLPGGDVLIGWGSQPFLSEYSPGGRLLFDASFPRGGESYRAYRFPWQPTPPTAPAVAASSDGHGTTTVYASWNGAAGVARWQVIAGSDPRALRPVATAPGRDFETAIRVRIDQPLVAVRAVDARGRVLSTSAAAHPKAVATG